MPVQLRLRIVLVTLTSQRSVFDWTECINVRCRAVAVAVNTVHQTAQSVAQLPRQKNKTTLSLMMTFI